MLQQVMKNIQRKVIKYIKTFADRLRINIDIKCKYKVNKYKVNKYKVNKY